MTLSEVERAVGQLGDNVLSTASLDTTGLDLESGVLTRSATPYAVGGGTFISQVLKSICQAHNFCYTWYCSTFKTSTTGTPDALV
jgi:hypothetical protein